MLTDIYRRDGVLMTTVSGADYPDAFSHPCIEYASLVGNVALIDLTHWGLIRLTGSDRTRFLNAMVTNDVDRLELNAACHAALTTVKGKLVAELYILKRDLELIVIVAQGSTARVVEVLDKHIIADDVELTDISSQFGVLSVEGPESRKLTWRLFPDGPLPTEVLAFGDTEYMGTPITVLRNSVSGEKGMQLIVPVDDIALFRSYIVQAGRGLDMELVGHTAWNIRRVENGLPWFGPDIGDDNFPKETRLDDVVNYEKGCYLGQETLARMHYRGHPNWLLVGMAPENPVELLKTPAFVNNNHEDLPLAPSSPLDVRQHIDALLLRDTFSKASEIHTVVQGDSAAKAIGRVTSPVISLMRGQPLLMGYVRARTADQGDPLVLKIDDETYPLKIVSLPLEGE